MFRKGFLFFLGMALTIQLHSLEPHWKPTKHIWNMGLALLCDVRPKQIPYRTFCASDYQNIRDGDIVWLDTKFIPDFAKQVFPKVRARFALYTNHTYYRVPMDSWSDPNVRKMANDPRLLHWFTQNHCPPKNFPKEKLTAIPQGLDFHTLSYRKMWQEELKRPFEQEAVLEEILQTSCPVKERLIRVVADFHLNDTLARSDIRDFVGETRAEIYEKLKNNPSVDFLPHKFRRGELWEIKSEYAFSISPPGLGLDCHRTWEDLALGCIVIVKRSPLDPVYDVGFPIVIVDSWDEITRENLQKWLMQHQDSLSKTKYRKHLTNNYWIKKMRKIVRTKLR